MKQHFYHSDGGGSKRLSNADLSFDPEFIIIDLFCGAGGTTTGFENAFKNGTRIAKVVACVNHDPIAIKSHWANHPEVVHYEEDIRSLDLGPLSALVEDYRVLYPKSKIILWASLECTNFSKAKGGQPRDADSRTLADHLERYIIALNPDYVQIENVVEFMSWGPLDERGKPISRQSGSDWLRWRREICELGYYDEWKQLNSADFGAYTSRNRLFGCFAKPGLKIVWPTPSHSKKPITGGLFNKSLAKWKPVKDVLDFSDEGVSIFTRKKPLSDKTLERIYAGLVKYVAGGKDAFMVKYNSISKNGSFTQTATDIDNPCHTISTQGRLGMCFIAKYYSGRPEGKVIPVDGPAGTITTSDGQTLVQPIPSSFIAKYYGNGNNLNSVEEPAGTLTTKDRLSKVQPIWIDREFSGGGQNSSIESPCGTLLPTPKTNIVQAKPFIMKTSFGNVGSSIENPSPVIDASRHYHYIINPSHGGHSSSIEKPCPVVIARQDKAPLYLTNVYLNQYTDISIEKFLKDDDIMFLQALIDNAEECPCEMSVRLKIIEFMSLYDIADIKMRMLNIGELKTIQGFPRDYILCGTQTDQKKFIGNSVVPNVVKSWCEAMSIN